jgi:hypothetical protein
MADVFPIVPAQGKVLFIIGVFVIALMAAVTVVMILAMRGGGSSRFEMSNEGLRLRGDLYGRTIPWSALRTREARIVDLGVTYELAPTSRTAGTAVPGYQSGWFRLSNGEKALLYLTDRQRAVYVPTTQGYSLLLSPREPQRFLERLQQPH